MRIEFINILTQGILLFLFYFTVKNVYIEVVSLKIVTAIFFFSLFKWDIETNKPRWSQDVNYTHSIKKNHQEAMMFGMFLFWEFIYIFTSEYSIIFVCMLNQFKWVGEFYITQHQYSTLRDNEIIQKKQSVKVYISVCKIIEVD